MYTIKYIDTGINISSEHAAYLSALYDIGSIAGGIAAGLISDRTGKSASTCAAMLIAAIPMVIYISYSSCLGCV